MRSAARSLAARSTRTTLAVLLLVAGAEPDVHSEPPAQSGPAAVTQSWPPHANGAERPLLESRDTDPNAPAGGCLWRWAIVPAGQPAAPETPAGPPSADAPVRRICTVEVVPTRAGEGGWVEDEAAHIAGELSLQQQTRDGRDLWESDSSSGVWRSAGCARALPETGFTFQVSVTRKELARARIQRVRFRLAGEAGAPAAGGADGSVSIDAWTDILGERRAVPLTAPVTDVGLAPVLDGARSAAAGWGLRGIVLVRGARTSVSVRSGGAGARPFHVYTSLERDLDGDDPSPSGLRAVGAPLPEGMKLRVEPATSELSAAGEGAFAIQAPDEATVVGIGFYVQAGIGPQAALGLSCALRCTIVAALADYDGDGRPNGVDADLLDPER